MVTVLSPRAWIDISWLRLIFTQTVLLLAARHPQPEPGIDIWSPIRDDIYNPHIV